MNEDLQSIAFRLEWIMRDLKALIATLETNTPRTPILPPPAGAGAQFFQALTADDDAAMGQQQKSKFEQCPHN